MAMLYENYMTAGFDADGVLKSVAFHAPDSFNFGFDVVDFYGENEPGRRAMLWLSSDQEARTFTFGDMMRLSAKTANYLQSVGLRKGDRVLVVLRRHWQFWSVMVALHKLGAVAIPATDQLQQKDFSYRFEAAKVTAIICTPHGHTAEAADAAMAEGSPVKWKMMVGGSPRPGWQGLDAGVEAASDVFPRPSGPEATHIDDPMLMYFTSGTAGYPKIATHSYAYPLGHIVTARFWHNVNPEGLHFTFADTGWGKAVWGKLYGQWLCGAGVFTYDLDKFNARDLLPLFGKYKITTFCAPPTIYRFFIKEDLSAWDLSSIEYATTAGEAVNPEVFQRFYKASGLKLMEGFGQTETTLTIMNPVGSTPKPGSMGRPNPQYKVELQSPDGSETPNGVVGEIVVDTRNGAPYGMFSGYYRNGEKTREVWHDGYYHTGDMAWRDEDGYFWFVGRTDDLIKSSGYRISPFEIESVVMELPFVLECAATGVPDPDRGQIVKVTVVLMAGKDASDATGKEIQDYVKRHTAPYKYPRIVEFVEALPKTISGKIRRVELRETSDAPLPPD